MSVTTEEISSQSRLVIPNSIYETLPEKVGESLAGLTDEQQERFVEEFENRSKRTGVAYALFLLCGCHYAYMGRWGLQVIWWSTLGGLGVWAVVDLFRIPRLINRYNEEVAKMVTRMIKVLS